MSKNKLPLSILIIFMMVGSLICLADSAIEVFAKVDKTNISQDEFVQFTIIIEGTTDYFVNPEIKLPKLQDNFDIVATSQSNNISLKGRKTKISWQIQYTLSPKKEGRIQIDSAEIIFQGKTYKTNELFVTVNPSKSPQNIPKQGLPSKETPWSDKEGVLI